MDITPIVNAVIALAAAVVTAFVIPWIKSKTTTAQREEIEAWVRIAVTAAEQIYSDAGKGKEKKKYVLDFLAEKNLKIDEESVDLMIESAVKNMNQAFNGSLLESQVIQDGAILCVVSGKEDEND